MLRFGARVWFGVKRVRFGSSGLARTLGAVVRPASTRVALEPVPSTRPRRTTSPQNVPPRPRTPDVKTRRRRRVLGRALTWPTEPRGEQQLVHFGDRAVAVSDDRSLLASGLAAGIDLPFSCGIGCCGACKQRVSGPVEMQAQQCLSDEEIADGYRLLCVCRPLGEVKIED